MQTVNELLFCLVAILLFSVSPSAADDVKVEVIEVLNCHSLRVQTDEGPQVVRIAEVICPEELLIGLVDAEEGKRYLEKITADRQVTLSYWVTDFEGRLVSQVFLPDGRSLGALMVAKGHLLRDPFYSSSVNLENLQNIAKQEKLGAWQNYAVYKEFR